MRKENDMKKIREKIMGEKIEWKIKIKKRKKMQENKIIESTR